MKDIFEILGVPADAPKSMLKESFMQWKKAKQDVLRKGTLEEQKIAAEQISEVTALYKEAVKIVAAPEMMTEAERMASVHGKDKSGNANWGKTKDTSYWQRNSYSSENNNSDNNNKPIMIASVLILVICVCGGLYLFKDNNFSTRNISLPSFFSKDTSPELPKFPEPSFPDPPASIENSVGSDAKSSNSTADKNKANKSEVNAKKLTDEDIAREVFVKYHNALGKHNFHDAYGMMSPICKQNMGGPDKLAVSFRDTIESKAYNVTLVRTEKDEMVFDYVLDSKDKVENNKILYQTFKGQVHMFKINGEWKVGYSESKRINNYIK